MITLNPKLVLLVSVAVLGAASSNIASANSYAYSSSYSNGVNSTTTTVFYDNYGRPLPPPPQVRIMPPPPPHVQVLPPPPVQVVGQPRPHRAPPPPRMHNPHHHDHR